MRGLKNMALFLFILLVNILSAGDYRFDGLTKLADYYGTDKGSITHHYTGVYEYFFYPIKDSVKKVLEIGGGPSEYMFRDYFSSATIYAIDIDPQVKKEYEGERIIIFVGDQSKRDNLSSFIDKYGCDFDIILDDGGHGMDEQQISFGYLFKCVKGGGFYIIEDLHSSLGIDDNISTLGMIYHFINTGEIKSLYMRDDEMKYLERNIEYCVLLANRIKEESISVICRKYEIEPPLKLLKPKERALLPVKKGKK